MKIVCGMFRINRRKRFLTQCMIKLQNILLQDVVDAYSLHRFKSPLNNYIKERHFKNYCIWKKTLQTPEVPKLQNTEV